MAEMKKIIQEFYSKLYQRKDLNHNKQREYIWRNNNLKISEEEKKFLEEEITYDELKEAIKKQKINKAPGPDGIPVEVYKLLGKIIQAPFKSLLEDIWKTGKIPDSWRDATITMIHKPDTDKREIKNFRPISVLNADYKVFAAILAARLKKILEIKIHQDQTGFLPRRHLRSNVRTLIDILEYYEFNPGKKMGLVFLDAQKAFDNVNWNFMFNLMEDMGIGDKFLGAIKGIYTDQKAKIRINGDVTERIEIQQGTRQGCPLSPLLFIMTLEVLNNVIRQDVRLKGLKLEDEEIRLQAYADDIVFVLEDPKETIKFWKKDIEEYGEVAGLKVNYEKTKIMLKNIKKSEYQEFIEYGLQISDRVKYLGITMSTKTSTLVEDNYLKLLKDIRQDLEKWSKLQLSLMGRIATIKMNVLPRILFLFQTIPVILKKTFFLELNKITLNFVWNGKKPRIKLRLLQDDKLKAGMGVPNWLIYYQAAALNWVKDWINPQKQRYVELERQGLQIGWQAFLIYDKAKHYSFFRQHILRKSLLWAWDQIRHRVYLKLPNWIQPLEIANKPEWIRTEHNRSYKELLDGKGDLKDKDQLEKIGINLDWWLETQIISRLKEDKKIGIYTEETEFDKILLQEKDQFVRRMYKYLLQVEMADETVKETMIVWAKDIGRVIEVDEWEKIWSRNIKLTKATAYKENLYKMFYRWYLSPEKMAKMYKDVPNICWKCKKNQGSFYHMWWTCDKAKKFWALIREILEEMLGCVIPLSPELYLLNMIPTQFSKENNYMILHIVTAARLLYAQMWKNDEIPNISQLMLKFYEMIEMDSLSERLKEGFHVRREKRWNAFYGWLDQRMESDLNVDV